MGSSLTFRDQVTCFTGSALQKSYAVAISPLNVRVVLLFGGAKRAFVNFRQGLGPDTLPRIGDGDGKYTR